MGLLEREGDLPPVRVLYYISARCELLFFSSKRKSMAHLAGADEGVAGARGGFAISAALFPRCEILILEHGERTTHPAGADDGVAGAGGGLAISAALSPFISSSRKGITHLVGADAAEAWLADVVAASAGGVTALDISNSM
jgi:hypothetical protein